MFFTETALREVTNEWLWYIDNKHFNGVIFLDLKNPLTPWTMLFYQESLNSVESIVFLSNGFGRTYLIESSKPLLIELNRISVM